jgi:formate hydrogenlyase subunit 6/NADH:ubiquinone oxidoreductase subunit I
MIERLLRAWRIGVVTARYPDEPPVLEATARGLPVVDAARCTRERSCEAVCPTGAIAVGPAWVVDAGRCVFCAACERACPTGAIGLRGPVTLAATTTDGLLHVTPLQSDPAVDGARR